MQYFRNLDLHKLEPWLKEIEDKLNNTVGSTWDSNKQFHVYFDGKYGTKKAFALKRNSCGHDFSHMDSELKPLIVDILKGYGATGIIGKVSGLYTDIAFDFKEKVLNELGIETIDWKTFYTDELDKLMNLPSYVNPCEEDAIKYYK